MEVIIIPIATKPTDHSLAQLLSLRRPITKISPIAAAKTFLEVIKAIPELKRKKPMISFRPTGYCEKPLEKAVIPNCHRQEGDKNNAPESISQRVAGPCLSKSVSHIDAKMRNLLLSHFAATATTASPSIKVPTSSNCGGATSLPVLLI